MILSYTPITQDSVHIIVATDTRKLFRYTNNPFCHGNKEYHVTNKHTLFLELVATMLFLADDFFFYFSTKYQLGEDGLQ